MPGESISPAPPPMEVNPTLMDTAKQFSDAGGHDLIRARQEGFDPNGDAVGKFEYRDYGFGDKAAKVRVTSNEESHDIHQMQVTQDGEITNATQILRSKVQLEQLPTIKFIPQESIV